jgi:hypothetical protein
MSEPGLEESPHRLAPEDVLEYLGRVVECAGGSQPRTSLDGGAELGRNAGLGAHLFDELTP